MEGMVRINTTMNPELLKRVDFYAEQKLEDRSTAIRQLIAEGLKAELKAKVLNSLRDAKLTIREAAQLLGAEYWEIQQMIEEEGILAADTTPRADKNDKF